MPSWIHDRAEHILAKNPAMDKGQAFALATQQSHKLGKSPKGYGTAEGKRTARAKYRGPKKGYVQGANNGKLESSKMVEKRAGLARVRRIVAAAIKRPEEMTGELGVAMGSATMKNFRRQAKSGLTQAEYESARGFKDHVAKLTKMTEKRAFTVSQYSGPLSMGKFKQESIQPPFISPRVKTGGPPSQRGGKEKSAAGLAPATGMAPSGTQTKGPQISFSPTKQLNASKKVGVVKATPPGPSIAQISKPRGYGMPAPGALKATNKIAMAGRLRARMIRLGATDVPNTPRLLMRKRSPQELSTLQSTVERKIHSVQAAPIMRGAEPLVSALPQTAQGKARKMIQFAAENPEFVVPGGSALTAGKHGLVKLIDKVAPAAKNAT